MIGFVVVSHNRNLAEEAIRLSKMMQFEKFPIINGGGLTETDDFGTDATIIMDAINKANEGDGVIVFCELGSSVINSQMAIELINDENVKLINAPLVEGLIVGVSANNKNITLDELEKEILEIKNFDKI